MHAPEKDEKMVLCDRPADKLALCLDGRATMPLKLILFNEH
jgi:hypothetical protein